MLKFFFPFANLSSGFFLKTRDFLQPLERGEKGERGTGEAAAGAGSAPVERVLPGGVGAFSDSHAGARGGVEKAEAPQAYLAGFEAKAEPDHSRSTTTSYGSYAGGASPYTLWDDKDTASRGQWPSPFAAARHNSMAPEKKQLMEAAASRSSLGYDDADEEEEVFGKREGSSSSRKDFSIKADGKTSSADQRPNTPRSKHSATEQRRRSKINDRFQMLRETIPHSDQKRDKASFLLEVIEYIRFLQEKVQKYESALPTWNQNNAKLMPWHNNGQAIANGLSTPFQVIKDEPAPPTHMFSKKFDKGSTQVAAPVLSTVHSFPAAGVTAGNTYEPMETATSIASNLAAAAAAAASTPNLSQPRLFTVGRESSIAQPRQRLIKNPDNTASQDRSPWLRSCSVAGNAVGREVLGEQEELTINEGTINVSTAYSHGVSSALTQALQSSGVDLSQARISVQINLGKGAINKKPSDTATTSTVKDLKDPASIYQAIGYSRLGSGGEVLSQALKRRKAENS